MINALLSPQPLWFGSGLAIIRILCGLMMTYHGWEVFDGATMENYSTWDVIKNLPAAKFMVYVGKGLELVTGICFTFGFLTRIAALLMAIDLLYICFFIGNGKFYYEDQHPFLFALLATVFFFAGPVKWSLDQVIFKNTEPS